MSSARLWSRWLASSTRASTAVSWLAISALSTSATLVVASLRRLFIASSCPSTLLSIPSACMSSRVLISLSCSSRPSTRSVAAVASADALATRDRRSSVASSTMSIRCDMRSVVSLMVTARSVAFCAASFAIAAESIASCTSRSCSAICSAKPDVASSAVPKALAWSASRLVTASRISECVSSTTFWASTAVSLSESRVVFDEVIFAWPSTTSLMLLTSLDCTLEFRSSRRLSLASRRCSFESTRFCALSTCSTIWFAVLIWACSSASEREVRN